MNQQNLKNLATSFWSASTAKHNILTNSHLHETTINRSFATVNSAPRITKAEQTNETGEQVKITFDDGKTRQYPTLWLRIYCQCPLCYNHESTSRTLLFRNWQISDAIDEISVREKDKVFINWSNGHRGEFDAKWLAEHTLESDGQKLQSNFMLAKEGWSSDLKLRKFTFKDVLKNDSLLLDWLEELERKGALLMTGVPGDPMQGVVLAERIGLLKKTFFGEVSNVFHTEDANNLAYTEKALDLHNDLAYQGELPGVIVLSMIKQHTGAGGDSIISDGYYAAEVLRKNHPREFDILSNTEIYFTHAGVDANSLDNQSYQYDRVFKAPVLGLAKDGTFLNVRYSNHTMNPSMDMAPNQIIEFIKAFKIYGSLLEDNSVTYKLRDGEMLVLDNTRCQHGRRTIIGNSNRHLATSYMAWDDIRCKRRVLQKAFEETKS